MSTTKRHAQFARIIRQIRAWVADGSATPAELAAVLREFSRRCSDSTAAAMANDSPENSDTR